MFNKLSNKNLGVIFTLLLVIVIFLLFYDGGKTSRTFRENLVEIDTSAVTAIYIYPKSENHKEVKLFKDSDQWKVVLGENKTASIPSGKTTNLFQQLLTIKPKRLAARSSEKWNEYQVDSTGTRVVVEEDGEVTLDIILGKFEFKQPRSMSTFVRLTGDTDVFEVDGFLEITFNQNADSYRDNRIVKSAFEKWQRLTFDYPDASSFQIAKVNGKWLMNSVETDSAETQKYLSQLARMSSSNFVDEFESEGKTPTHKLSIETEEGDEIIVTGYSLGGDFIIKSSQNEESNFDGMKNNLMEKIFVGEKKFF